MIKNTNYNPVWGSSEKWDSVHAEAKLDLMTYWNHRSIRYQQILGYIPKEASSIIDFGCSLGTGLKMLESVNHLDIWGCDISEVAIRACQAKFPRCKVVSMSLLDIEKLNRRWAVGLLIQVLEHLDNPGEALSVILRCVDNLIVSVPRKGKRNASTGEHMWLFDSDDFVRCGVEVLEEDPIIIAKFQVGVKYEFEYLSP